MTGLPPAPLPSLASLLDITGGSSAPAPLPSLSFLLEEGAIVGGMSVPAPLPALSLLFSTGTAAADAAGALTASPAGVSGVVQRVVTDNGSMDYLYSGSAQISGTLARIIALSGTLTASPSAISGGLSVQHTHSMSGSLPAGSAALSGTISLPGTHGLSGALSARAATLSGTVSKSSIHSLSGTLTSGRAGISGFIFNPAWGTSNHGGGGGGGGKFYIEDYGVFKSLKKKLKEGKSLEEALRLLKTEDLEEYTDEDGEIDARALKRNPKALNRIARTLISRNLEGKFADRLREQEEDEEDDDFLFMSLF